ncbi:MAG TPA: siderophore-interacting protein, partial [Ramlibacter sp.]|nr:siderophore-interacting protein [Ramlibacter sp.]
MNADQPHHQQHQAHPPRRRVERVRHELRAREVEVTRIERLSPGFVAITFGADALEGFTSLSFDDHLKFMTPDGAGEMVRRDYTPRRFDAARRELTIEFALHGHGHASDWARQAAPGQRATVGGPRGSMVIPPDYDWHLLAGDATALPAIHRRLEELPASSRAIVVAQVDV